MLGLKIDPMLGLKIDLNFKEVHNEFQHNHVLKEEMLFWMSFSLMMGSLLLAKECWCSIDS